MRDNIAEMLRDIRQEVELTRSWIGKEHLDARVLAAMEKVPRHEFVPKELDYLAYSNGPLGIGHGQTISQPYIVALMTDLLNPQAGDVVLEVGTGSGYQAAVLSLLVKQVYSIEIVAALAQQATARLGRLGFDNVTVRSGDGYRGWQEHAPFDAIIVTAAAPSIPPPLLEQLKFGGCMVIPVGLPYGRQILTVVNKNERGEVSVEELLPVAFVPLTGDHGQGVKSGDDS
jgi:protein-L-isoaspartate(D-aspartate) O-methyltransferase